MSRLLAAPAARRRRPAGRRGTILVVVLALLAIFAVVGISFVFYSDGEMTAARYAREAETRNGTRLAPPPPNFDADAELALASIVFGADPGEANAQLNVFRGHDLLTPVYGAHGKADAVPYGGAGILHEDLKTSTITEYGWLSDRAHVVNNTAMNLKGTFYAFDPEIGGGPREVAKTAPIKSDDSSITGAGGATKTRTHAPKNAPYTYPDLNNFYLASISPATGEVVVPSYFRAWHFNNKPVQLSGYPVVTPAPLDRRLGPWVPSDPVLVANTDWVTAEGRAKILRPRPIDQLTGGELLPVAGKQYPPTAAELAAFTGPQITKLYQVIDDNIRAGNIMGYPRPNADGTYTGDVFNLIGGVGVQKNDSVLLDFGADPIQWPPGSGKWVKPLVSVLVTDLDGLLNLNAHGNVRTGNHVSFNGFGPWEVNLVHGCANAGEANGIVSSKYGSHAQPSARNGSTSLAFDPSARRLQTYGLVNWDASGSPKFTPAILVPDFKTDANPFAVVPNYAVGFYDDNTAPTKNQNHPALYNPADWSPFPENARLNPLPPTPAAPFGYSYSAAETRRLRERYAGDLDRYQQMAFNRIPLASLGTLVGSKGAGSGYRLDEAHPRRLLFTTLSAGLDLPGVMPHGIKSGTNFELVDKHAHAGALTNAGLGTVPMYGPVDLNRRLADYRTDTAESLDYFNAGAHNVGNANQAWADRHNLARDVFTRLVVSSGLVDDSDISVVKTAGADYGNLKIAASVTPAANQTRYDALRYLAQLAVNIVDYRDEDDVATIFIWNPSGATNGLATVDATTVLTLATTDMANAAERVVFGVEMPRVVINEAYAEVTNDHTETALGMSAPTKDAQVRVWVELLNPTTPPHLGGKDGPLGTGAATLYNANDTAIQPYRIQVGKGAAGDALRKADNVSGELEAGKVLVDFKFNSADIAGAAAKQTLAPNNGLYTGPTGIAVVGPDAGAYHAIELKGDGSAAPFNTPGNVYLKSGPITTRTNSDAMGYAFAMPTAAQLEGYAVDLGRHTILLRRLANPYLAYDVNTNPYVTVDVMDYVPAHDAVHRAGGDTADRSARTTPGTGAGYEPFPAAAPTPPVPGGRFAVGKVQPYAGFAAPAPGSGQPSPDAFPKSFVVQQVEFTNASAPLHSFFRHNGATATPTTVSTINNPGIPTAITEPIMAPYDWLVHFDRPLINQLELLHVQAARPHELTHYFLQPPDPAVAGQGVRKHVGLAPWFGLGNTGGAIDGMPYSNTNGSRVVDTTANAQTRNGLYRGLEYLRVKPWTYGAGSGGRVHGRINLNTVQDIRVWTGLADPQPASAFNKSETDKLWTTYFTQVPGTKAASVGVRTFDSAYKTDATGAKWTVPTPGETVDDADAYDPTYTTLLLSLDRPFKPFGVADAPTDAKSAVSPAGSGIQDTILRTDPNRKGTPHLWANPNPAPPVPVHPYLEAELARKMVNNTTTVSNVFGVHFTVVYHEVRLDPATGLKMFEGVTGTGVTNPASGQLQRFYLGREAFREVPGDMRQQYFALVDRSNAVVDAPLTLPATSTTAQTLAKMPFSASLGKAVAASATTVDLFLDNATTSPNGVLIYADGKAYEILGDPDGAGPKTGTTLVIGTGTDAEVVSVSSIGPGGAIRVPSLSRPHAVGALVSNYIPGRPVGPGTNYNPITKPGDFLFGYLIPYTGRVR